MSIPEDPRETQLRRCSACAQVQVACVHVSEHRVNEVLPLGRTYMHQCRECGRRFITESPLRSLVVVVFGALLLLAGGGFVAVFSSTVLPALMDGSMEFELPSLHQIGVIALFIAMAIAGLYLLLRSAARWIEFARNPAA